MPSIVIVDDESIFRKGLRKIIAELDPEWEVVGEAIDGYEALQLVEELRPDAILTDIRMPRMDGIQLQQIIHDRFPAVLCVVISGFDEFTYVQQSMRQGAKDYMMKPIERGELARILAMLKEKVKEQRGEGERKSHRDEFHMRQHVSEHLVAGLLRGSVNDDDLELLRKIGIEFDWPYFACMVIKLDKSSVGSERYNKADPSLFLLYIQQLAQEVLNRRGRGFCFVMSDTDVVALLNLQDRYQAMEDVREMGESIRRQMTTLSNMTVTVGIGQAAEGIDSVPGAYHEAEIALLYRLIVGGDKVIVYEEAVRWEMSQFDQEPRSWDDLEQAVQEGNTVRVGAEARAFVNALCLRARKPEAVHQQLCKLLIHYYEWAGKLGLTEQWLGTNNMRTVLYDICSISSREELTDEFSALLVRLTNAAAEKAAQPIADPIEKSVRYMEKHYSEPLTLKEVADFVYLNATYFSTLFKQRTGKTFIERLTELRIEEAKRRMVYSDEKIAAIAELAGFANIRHFNRVFKCETGMSPKEYRDRGQSRTGNG